MELINRIIKDEELSAEDKAVLIEKVFKASHGMDRFITPGFYLHTDKNEETGEIDIQLWFRNVDESGTTMHGPTNYDCDAIVDMMKNECLNEKGKIK